MGIPGFFNVIQQKYLSNRLKKVAIPQKHDEKVDYVYLDINNFLYHMNRSSASITVQWTLDTIYMIWKSLQPRKLLYLALDGPGPIGKLPRQRERRAQALYETRHATISSLLFTPGTTFMDELKQGLLKFAEKVSPTVDVIVSASDCADEAEIKIFSHINSIPIEESNRIVVVGNDADTILFALRSAHARSIQIARLQGGIITFVPIAEIMESIVAEFPGLPIVSKRSIINDFVFVNLLNGNDFLPKLRYCTLIWNFYKKIFGNSKRSLWNEDEKTINAQFLKELDASLFALLPNPSNEPFTLKSDINNLVQKYRAINVQYISRSNSGNFAVSAMIDGRVFAEAEGSTQREVSEKISWNLLNSKDFVEYLAQDQSRGVVEEDVQYIAQLAMKSLVPSDFHARKYIEGLLWSMEYYHGNCLNYRFNFPFSFCPSFSSINQYLQENPNIKPEINSWSPLSAAEFCVAVMPGEAKQYLPSSLQFLQDADSPLYDLFFTPTKRLKKWARSEIEPNVDRIRNAISFLPKHKGDAHKLRHQPSVLVGAKTGITVLSELPIKFSQIQREFSTQAIFINVCKRMRLK